jgi:hypothetical protein
MLLSPVSKVVGMSKPGFVAVVVPWMAFLQIAIPGNFPD